MLMLCTNNIIKNYEGRLSGRATMIYIQQLTATLEYLDNDEEYEEHIIKKDKKDIFYSKFFTILKRYFHVIN